MSLSCPLGNLPMIDGYDLGDELGRGGYATVYGARAAGSERRVALKLADTVADRRFAQETAAMIAAGATAPQVLESGTTADGRPFIAMERLVGRSLADAIANRDALPIAVASTVFAAIARTVATVHASGWVHLDLKPENIWVEIPNDAPPAWRLRLIDFGLARAIGTTDARRGPDAGTPLYMAPEQSRGGARADPRTDIYALGVIGFELFAGRVPFVARPGETVAAQHASHRPPPLSRLRDSIPQSVETTIASCLRKELLDRPTNAGEVAEGLRASSPKPAAAPGAQSLSAAATKSRRALIALHGSLNARSTTASARSAGGILAHLADDLVVFAFDGDSEAASINAALAFARPETTDDVGAVIKLAALRIRRRGDREIVRSSALGDIADWQPRARRGAIVLGTEAAVHLEDALRQAIPGGCLVASPEVVGTSSAQTRVPFRGRAEILHRLLATTLEGKPSIATVIGEVGMGKSRLLDELASELAEGTTAYVLDGNGDDGDSGADEAAFLGQLFGGRGTPPVIRFRAGELPATDRRISPLLATPGAMRSAISRAIAERLGDVARETPVVVLLDNAHKIDHALLDGFELAALPESGHPITVVATAAPVFAEVRRGWGARCPTRVEATLGPLSKSEALEVARDSLAPAEYIPAEILERLWTVSEGVPLYLAELADSIRFGGAIRQQDGTGTWFIDAGSLLAAADGLVGSRSQTVFELLATRALSRIPSTLKPILEIAAVLGDNVSRALARAYYERADAASVPVGNIDPGIGLDSLVRCGVLRNKAPGQYTFRHSLLRRSIERTIQRNKRRELHAIAFDLLSSDTSHGARLRCARHAIACGQTARGARMHVALGEEARARHRYLDAEEHYSAALALDLPTSEEETAATIETAFAGRGRIRHYGYRESAALLDLTRAAELATSLGADLRVADHLLIKADVADCMMDWAEQRRCLSEAEALLGCVDDDVLSMRATLRRGVVEYRAQNLVEARPLLTDAAERAGALGDAETETVALLVLATLLTYLGQYAESEARFDEVIEVCNRTGDRKSLGFALSNRCELWSCTRMHHRAQDDAAAAAKLARELGNPLAERVAQHNLAELLYFAGAYDDALKSARRSRELEERFFPEWSPADPLLLARILFARGDHAATRRWLDWAAHNCAESTWQASQLLTRDVLRLAIERAAKSEEDEIRALAARAESEAQNEPQQLELLLILAQVADSAGHAPLGAELSKSGAERAADDQLWTERFAALRSQ